MAGTVVLQGLSAAVRAVTLTPGEVLALETGTSSTTSGVVQVTSGNRVLVSGGNSGTDAAIDLPLYLTTGAWGTLPSTAPIYYFETRASGTANHVILVDPGTPARSVVSGSSRGTGPAFATVTGLCWEWSTAKLLVCDAGDSAATAGILRVNPSDGVRALVTGNGAGSGVDLDTPRFITCTPAGTIYYFETAATATLRCVIAVSSNGTRTKISGNGTGSGTDFVAVTGMCWDQSTGTLLVSDAGSSAATARIIRVDPANGNRTTVSASGTGVGVSIDTPKFVTCSKTGQIYYYECLASGAAKSVVSVNPANGDRAVASGGSGTAFVSVSGLAMVFPPPVPVISSALAASGTYRTAFSTYQITASESPTTYGATGLPTGLSVDSSTGEISGTPLQAGTFNVTISATNPGGTGTATLVLTLATRPLTVSGLTAVSRTYDATLVVGVTGTGTLNGILSGDSVTLVGSPVGAFATTAVGTAKTVTVSGYSLGSTHAANYSLTAPTSSANVTAKALTVTGLGASNKVYDTNTSATLTGTAALQSAETPGTGTTSDGRPYSGDTVALSGTASGTFATKDSGTAKTVTVSGLTLAGISAGNYTVTPPTTTADITAKQLTVTADNQSRAYGAANPTLTASYGGFAGSETSSVLTGSPAVTTAATTSTVPGTYPITAAIGTLAALNSNYSFTFVSGTLTITADPRVSWRVAHFGTTDNTGSAADTADADNDGLVNLLEYALNSDPLVPTADALPVLSTTDVSGSTYLTLAVARNSAATDLTFTVEATADLSNSGAWTSAGLVTLANTASNLTVRDSTALNGAPRYLRLRVAVGVATAPVGGRQFTLGGGSASVPVNTNAGLPFARPMVWCSAASGVTSQTITVAPAGWSAARFTSSPHYVELLDGPLAGLLLDITSHTSTTLTLASSSLSGYAAGMRFAIRPHATLASAFGATNPASLAAATTIAAADELRLFDPVTQQSAIYYYKNGGLGGTGWRSGASTSADRAATVIRPEWGFIIVRKSSDARSVVAVGEAHTTAVIYPVEPGYNYLTLTQPVSRTLSQLGLITGNASTGMVGSIGINTADELQRWTGSAWERLYYETSVGGWRSSTDSTTERGSQVFQTGELINIQRKRSGEALFTRPAAP